MLQMPTMPLRRKQIFVVEDNMTNRVIFNAILIKQGADVAYERWGSTAILQLKTLPHVDVIIMDLMLSGNVTGYDVFDQIRALPEYKNVPIVAVSASDPGESIQKTRAKGFAGFIAKPIDNVLFPQQIASIIAGEHIWHANARTF